MDTAVIVLIVCALVTLATVAGILIAHNKQKNTKRETQRVITDKALLQLFADQPDGMLNKKLLAEATDLTPHEASLRLSSFSLAGITKTSYTSGFKYYFELVQPLEEKIIPALSPEPFLTVDDILKLFAAYDYKLDFQDLIMATGLPLDILKREMKYFEKEKVLKTIYTSNTAGTVTQRRFILQEPYRSQPTQFREREREMNEKVKEILRSDLLI